MPRKEFEAARPVKPGAAFLLPGLDANHYKCDICCKFNVSRIKSPCKCIEASIGTSCAIS